jgi:hypothetical protein
VWGAGWKLSDEGRKSGREVLGIKTGEVLFFCVDGDYLNSNLKIYY